MEKMIFAADALAGQICLVTGASRGIGRAVFEAFLQAGAVVIGTATSEAGAAALDEAGKAFEGRGRGIVLNVCDAEASKKAVDDIVAEYGRIDVLINNAGITKDGLVMRMKDEQWETVIETDLTAAFRLARACVRPMMKQRSGRIISMSSVVGAMGNAGQVNYAAAKAGLVGRAGNRFSGHHCQLHRTGLHRHRHDKGSSRRAQDGADRSDRARSSRPNG